MTLRHSATGGTPVHFTGKCVQQEWSSTGETVDAVESTFQPAGR